MTARRDNLTTHRRSPIRTPVWSALRPKDHPMSGLKY